MIENSKQANSRVCTEKHLPPVPESAISPPPRGAKMAVFNLNMRWNIDVIKVHFMQKIKLWHEDYVLKCAREWSDHCRIKFEKCPNEIGSDIRIDFKNDGSWSVVGAFALHASYDKKPTMNLDVFCSENDRSEAAIRGTILHEFGHALGFEHEHQSPNSELKWNRQKVTDYYMGKPNEWTEKMVEDNILRKLDDQGLSCTKWDPKSIMHYGFASEFLLDNDGCGISDCYELSAMDKKKVAEAYPDSQQQQQQDPSPVPLGQSGSGKPPADYRPPALTKTDEKILHISSVKAFMEHFRDPFTREMEAMAIVNQLEVGILMPVSKCREVENKLDPFAQRAIIYTHMKEQSNCKTLLGLCKAMRAADGFQQTVALGVRMQTVLEQNWHNFPENGLMM